MRCKITFLFLVLLIIPCFLPFVTGEGISDWKLSGISNTWSHENEVHIIIDYNDPTPQTVLWANRVGFQADHVGGNDLFLNAIDLLTEYGYVRVHDSQIKFSSQGCWGSYCCQNCFKKFSFGPMPVKKVSYYLDAAGGDDDIYWGIDTPFAENAYEEHKEVCFNGEDNDFDGLLGVDDIDCYNSEDENHEFACSNQMNNLKYKVDEYWIGYKSEGGVELNTRDLSDALLDHDAKDFGCRDIIPNPMPFFDLDTTPGVLGRTQEAKAYVYLEQAKQIRFRANYDNSAQLIVNALDGENEDEIFNQQFDYVPGEETRDITMGPGWNEIRFITWNHWGSGYGELWIDGHSSKFDKIQSWYVGKETVCNDEVDNNQDGLTDMEDVDCSEICDAYFNDVENWEDYDGSASNGNDGCCGDDPRAFSKVETPIYRDDFDCSNCRSYSNGFTRSDFGQGYRDPNSDDGYSMKYSASGEEYDESFKEFLVETALDPDKTYKLRAWFRNELSSGYIKLFVGDDCGVCEIEKWKGSDTGLTEVECSGLDCENAKIIVKMIPTVELAQGSYPEFPGRDPALRGTAYFDSIELVEESVGEEISDYGDRGFISEGQDYYCSDDNKDGNIVNPGIDGAEWKWWTAYDVEHAYEVHALPGLTQVLPNGDKFFVCDASDTYSSDYEGEEYESLPPGSYPLIGSENINLLRHWPDDDCDGVPNSQEARYPDECAVEEPEKLCYECDMLDEGTSCYTMSYCEFVNSPWGEDMPLPTCDFDLPDCAREVIDDPCKARSWGNVRVAKAGWTYPEASQCENEDVLDLCIDGEDNDYDGMIDCYDPGCYEHKGEEGWEEMSDCPEALEKCDILGDEDDNGLADCDDPVCTYHESCQEEEEQEEYKEPYDHFMCYQSRQVNYWAECCPTGELCYTNNPTLLNNRRNVMIEGTSWNNLNSLMIEIPNNPGITYNDVVLDMETKREVALQQKQVKLSEIKEIRFNLWFESIDFTVKICYESGICDEITEVDNFLTNGNYSRTWHTFRLPRNKLQDDDKILQTLEFGGEALISVDNIEFVPADDAHQSDTRYCTKEAGWVGNLDESKSACNSQNPQGTGFGGVGGHGWTGNYCCGDDSTHNSYEYFADEKRGCFMGNVIDNNRVVGDLFGTASLTGNEKDKYRDLVFFNKEFQACQPGQEEEYDSLNAAYQDDEYDGDDEGDKLVGTYAGTCEYAGSHFCHHSGVWVDRGKESEVWIEVEGGEEQAYRCGGGEKVHVGFSNDWLDGLRGTCEQSSCYCPAEDDFEGECDETDQGCYPGFEECAELERDDYGCVPENTRVKEKVCVQGHWTTKTGIAASHLYDKASEADTFTLICGKAQHLLYEPEYWDDSASENVCVLNYLDGNRRKVILGTAINEDQTYSKLEQAYKIRDSPLMKVNVNIDLKKRGDEEYDYTPLDLSTCNDNNGKCHDMDDDFRVYSENEYGIAYFTFEEDMSEIESFDDVASLFNPAGTAYEILERLFSTWKDKDVAVRKLPTNLETLYYNYQGEECYIYAYGQEAYKSHSDGQIITENYVMIESKGVSPDYFTMLGLNSIGSANEDGVVSRLYTADADDNPVAKLQSTRLDCDTEYGGRNSPVSEG